MEGDPKGAPEGGATRSPERWCCPPCAEERGQSPTYPPSPDTYCTSCRRPLDASERLAAAASALVRVLASNAAAANEPGAATGGETCTAREAAALLGTTVKGLYALFERGLLPPSIGPGRRLLFRRRDLLESRARRAPLPGRNRR